jgi:ABC-type lipoprotein export system ATPase subunit
MLQCDLKTTLLSYIGEVDYKQEVKNIEISHTDDIIKHNEAVIEQNEVVMTISQDTILFDTLNVSDVVQV